MNTYIPEFPNAIEQIRRDQAQRVRADLCRLARELRQTVGDAGGDLSINTNVWFELNRACKAIEQTADIVLNTPHA